MMMMMMMNMGATVIPIDQVGFTYPDDMTATSWQTWF